jgi:hypothetical protein
MTQLACKINFRQIQKMSCDRVLFLMQLLLPGGTPRGGEWIVRNPKRRDTFPGSFKINLTTGQWADFATGDKGGDLISLVAYLDGISQFSAAKKLAGILGVRG